MFLVVMFSVALLCLFYTTGDYNIGLYVADTNPTGASKVPHGLVYASV